jgi:hypothetical protein
MTHGMRRRIASALVAVATIVGVATAVAAITGPVVSARPGVVPLRCVDPTKDCTHLGPDSGAAVQDAALAAAVVCLPHDLTCGPVPATVVLRRP